MGQVLADTGFELEAGCERASRPRIPDGAGLISFNY
jgi:hypothetical protein